jgi:hypothetical protein
MIEQSAHESETRDRLSRMEREIRRLRVAGALTLSLAAVVVAGAMAQAPTKELSVRTLRIVDSRGRDRIVLTAEPGVPDMIFYDPAGKSRLTLDIADDDKPVLLFSESSQAKSRMTLGLEEGSPMLQFYDRAGKKRVAFGVPKTGGPVIRIMDANEKLQMRLP